MDKPPSRTIRSEDAGFLTLVVLVSLAFAWLVAPYFGAILWGLVAAILFAPLDRRIASALGGRRTLATVLTLLLIVALVIIPALAIGTSLVQEAGGLYAQVKSGQIDFGEMFYQIRRALPRWARELLSTAGLSDVAHAREMFGTGIASGLQSVASQAFGFGQGALRFLASLGVMLYLTFFLLRDGEEIIDRVREALPLRPDLRDELFNHFAVVVRATMKGSVVVAVVQGVLGGLIFWMLGIEGALLWGLLMGFFSLVPAVGTGIVWVPVAIYLFITGAMWQAAVLVGCGLFVIGLIDNILRPILVGHDTRMPDFVVLIATLAGIDLFGLNGFIIGPVIAALFIAVWKLVAEVREGEDDGSEETQDPTRPA